MKMFDGLNIISGLGFIVHCQSCVEYQVNSSFHSSPSNSDEYEVDWSDSCKGVCLCLLHVSVLSNEMRLHID